MSDPQLAAKFSLLAAGAIAEPQAARALRMLQELETQDQVAPLCAALAG
jgi:hypothetical protein